MTLWIFKQLRKLIQALESGQNPNQLAGGFVFGLLIGLPPFYWGYQLLLILIMLIIDVHIGMAVFGFALFSTFSFLLDPLTHYIGHYFLVDAEMTSFWIMVYQLPYLPYTYFNNTVMLGSIILSLILLLPCFIGFKKFIPFYLNEIKPRIEKMKIVKAIKGSALAQWYDRIAT